jgi:hypothetical protein
MYELTWYTDASKGNMSLKGDLASVFIAWSYLKDIYIMNVYEPDGTKIEECLYTYLDKRSTRY